MTLILVILAVPVAVILGMVIGDSTSRAFWREHNYCPTCDRLSTELEGWVRDAAERWDV